MNSCCNIDKHWDVDLEIDEMEGDCRPHRHHDHDHHDHHHHDHDHHDHHHRDHHRRDRHRNNERPLVLIDSIPHNGQRRVSPNIKAIKLIFCRDFNNNADFFNAGIDIDMWQGRERVPIRIRRVRNRRGAHSYVILVIPVYPLLGGEIYKVRVRSFYEDYDERLISNTRLIVFTTRCRS